MSKIRTNVMTKTEIKEALDNITEMSDEDLKNNCEYIRKISKESCRQIREMESKLSIALSKKKKHSSNKPSINPKEDKTKLKN